MNKEIYDKYNGQIYNVVYGGNWNRYYVGKQYVGFTDHWEDFEELSRYNLIQVLNTNTLKKIINNSFSRLNDTSDLLGAYFIDDNSYYMFLIGEDWATTFSYNNTTHKYNAHSSYGIPVDDAKFEIEKVFR